MPAFRLTAAVLLVLPLIAPHSIGAQEPAGGAPQAPLMGAIASEKVLPDIRFQDVPFPEVIEFLRQADPAFQAVVSREAGVPGEEPMIGEVQLRNVTASQVLQVLGMTYPELHVGQANVGAATPIWTVRVRQRSGPMPEPAVTATFRLREAIDGQMQNQDREAARNSVMSLLETALVTAACDTPAAAPQLRLHEATETLVFRGTASQARLVQSTLATLLPPKRQPDKLQTELERLDERVAELELRLGLRGEGTPPPASPRRPESPVRPTPPARPEPPPKAGDEPKENAPQPPR